MRRVEFRGGRLLARVFLVIEPVVGLRRAERIMVWLITHRPFWLRDPEDESEGKRDA